MNTVLSPRLSQSLSLILADMGVRDRLTLNELIQRTELRGVYLLMILLSLPFISPIPLPGLSNVVGLVIVILAIQIARGRTPRLPRFIGERAVSHERMEAVLRASGKFLEAIEKLIKPRFGHWLNSRAARRGNALLLTLLGLLLALPVPPVLPFTNSLPAWGIIVIAISLIEKDGISIWIGYAIAPGTLLYLVFFAGLLAVGLDRALHFFQSL
ncbi:MAG: exopolysaccharide biosynthesis protein [Verrucomicrobia bacterium]|nr:MAG: exopolysaccharide biosynthesis protein [Verrucomicrobiota bacterium]